MTPPMKTTVYLFVALALTMTATARADQFTEAMTQTSPECQALKDAFTAALVDPTGHDETLKVSEIPKLIQGLKEKGVFTPTESADIKKKVEDAQSFKDLAATFNGFALHHCFGPRLNISRALITSFKNPKLPEAQKKEIIELMRTTWKSEINSMSVGLAVNSALMQNACENKFDKAFNVQCDGLKEFRGKLREYTRDMQHEAGQAMHSFSFTGRILFYWDKWVLRKDMLNPNKKPEPGHPSEQINFDRYYDVGPMKKILLDEYVKTQELRTEFEKHIL
jgi:hypothetical protein